MIADDAHWIQDRRAELAAAQGRLKRASDAIRQAMRKLGTPAAPSRFAWHLLASEETAAHNALIDLETYGLGYVDRFATNDAGEWIHA